MADTKAARKPQDHKTKDDDKIADVEVEVDGITLTIRGEVWDDFELIDALAEADSGTTAGGMRLPAVLRMILGQEQFLAAMNHLRDAETGRVPIEKAKDFIVGIFEAVNPNS